MYCIVLHTNINLRIGDYSFATLEQLCLKLNVTQMTFENENTTKTKAK